METSSYDEWYRLYQEDANNMYSKTTARSRVIGKVVSNEESEKIQRDIDTLTEQHRIDSLRIKQLEEDLQLRIDYANECRAQAHEISGLKTDVKFRDNIIARRDTEIKELKEKLKNYMNYGTE